ncbi:MAG: type II toxin-antitoxin system RelE/ParE family toxin [Magnetococcales bacterium]|nr:type II toxin-antitoxin system RelE/ParE family toxin [Magnetococcales bacterium]
MIQSFRCAETQKLFETGDSVRWRVCLRQAVRKLQMLDQATELRDLAQLPGNRLEALKGDREGTWSMRVNDRWRLCFVWKTPHAYEVEIVDYHR